MPTGLVYIAESIIDDSPRPIIETVENAASLTDHRPRPAVETVEDAASLKQVYDVWSNPGLKKKSKKPKKRKHTKKKKQANLERRVTRERLPFHDLDGRPIVTVYYDEEPNPQYTVRHYEIGSIAHIEKCTISLSRYSDEYDIRTSIDLYAGAFKFLQSFLETKVSTRGMFETVSYYFCVEKRYLSLYTPIKDTKLDDVSIVDQHSSRQRGVKTSNRIEHTTPELNTVFFDLLVATYKVARPLITFD